MRRCTFDLTSQVVDLDLHDRAAARVGHERPGEGEHPRHERRDDRLHARLLPGRERPAPREKCPMWSQTPISSCGYVAKRRLLSLHKGVHRLKEKAMERKPLLLSTFVDIRQRTLSFPLARRFYIPRDRMMEKHVLYRIWGLL